jgi:hypothetical protein
LTRRVRRVGQDLGAFAACPRGGEASANFVSDGERRVQRPNRNSWSKRISRVWGKLCFPQPRSVGLASSDAGVARQERCRARPEYPDTTGGLNVVDMAVHSLHDFFCPGKPGDGQGPAGEFAGTQRSLSRRSLHQAAWGARRGCSRGRKLMTEVALRPDLLDRLGKLSATCAVEVVNP